MIDWTTLYISKDDENGRIVEFSFDVPTDWLRVGVEDDYGSFARFLDEYTSDEALSIYEEALEDGMTSGIVRLYDYDEI